MAAINSFLKEYRRVGGARSVGICLYFIIRRRRAPTQHRVPTMSW